MFKLTALLCVLVVCGLAQASEIDGSRAGRAGFMDLDKAKAEFEKIVNDAVQWVKENIEKYTKSAEEIVEKLKLQAQEIVETIRKQATDLIGEALKEITDELSSAGDKVDVSSCKDILKDALKSHEDYIKDVNKCVDGKIDEGLGYVKNITNVGEEVLQEFGNLKNEASECVKDVKGFGNIFKAIVCVNKAAFKAAVAAAKKVPSVIKSIGHITVMVQGLPASLPACVLDNGLTTGINVDECIDMATGIRNTTLKVIIDSALCVDQEIAKGSKQLGSISDNIDFVTKKLQEIKVEAAECFKDIHNLRTALNGYLCVQKAGKKVGYMATEQMPSLTTDSFKLGTKLSSVTISLKQCSTDKGLQTINESYNTVTASILNCVHHTMTNRMLEFEEHSYE